MDEDSNEQLPRISTSLAAEQSTPSLSSYFPANGKRVDRYSDLECFRISQYLRHDGHTAWSEVPRLYIVLRLIKQLQLLDRLVDQGITDLWLPFAPSSLPRGLPSSAHGDFLEAQKAVLTKAVDLEGGSSHGHAHFGKDDLFPLELMGKLGTNHRNGAFANVVKMYSPLSKRAFAVKRFRRRAMTASQRDWQSFITELQILKRIDHRHCVELISSYTDTKYFGLIMSPVADSNLGTFLDQPYTDHLRLQVAKFYGCLASALSYVHESKIRHRDIKPENVLVKGSQVYLTDFGISLDWQHLSRSTTTEDAGKSLIYCAPEVAQVEKRNSASDIWSLGCIFVEMFTVQKNRSRADLRAYLMKYAETHRFYVRPDIVRKWITDTRDGNTPADNQCSDWIQSMLAVDPASRPSASHLYQSMSTYSRQREKHLALCGACCTQMSDSSSEDLDDHDDDGLVNSFEQYMAHSTYRNASGHSPMSLIKIETGDHSPAIQAVEPRPLASLTKSSSTYPPPTRSPVSRVATPSLEAPSNSERAAEIPTAFPAPSPVNAPKDITMRKGPMAGTVHKGHGAYASRGHSGSLTSGSGTGTAERSNIADSDKSNMARTSSFSTNTRSADGIAEISRNQYPNDDNYAVTSYTKPQLLAQPGTHSLIDSATHISTAGIDINNDPALALVLEELMAMGITKDQIADNQDFIISYIKSRIVTPLAEKRRSSWNANEPKDQIKGYKERPSDSIHDWEHSPMKAEPDRNRILPSAQAKKAPDLDFSIATANLKALHVRSARRPPFNFRTTFTILPNLKASAWRKPSTLLGAIKGDAEFMNHVRSRDQHIYKEIQEAKLPDLHFVLDVLLWAGLKINSKTYVEYDVNDEQGTTPLLWALHDNWKEHPDPASIFGLFAFFEADIEHVRGDGRTVLSEASAQGYVEVLNYLLRHRGCNIECADDAGHTPLHLAARHGAFESARTLIWSGANVQAKTTAGKTSFEYACQFGHTSIVKLFLENVVDCLAVCRGTDVETAASVAAARGDVETVASLVGYGRHDGASTKDG